VLDAAGLSAQRRAEADCEIRSALAGYTYLDQ
jgi:hypothetical protein